MYSSHKLLTSIRETKTPKSSIASFLHFNYQNGGLSFSKSYELLFVRINSDPNQTPGTLMHGMETSSQKHAQTRANTRKHTLKKSVIICNS